MITVDLPLSAEAAVKMARHWAERRSSGRTPEFTPDDYRELLAWVRGEMARKNASVENLGRFESARRAVLLSHVSQVLGLSLLAGEALCEAAGWPS